MAPATKKITLAIVKTEVLKYCHHGYWLAAIHCSQDCGKLAGVNRGREEVEGDYNNLFRGPYLM